MRIKLLLPFKHKVSYVLYLTLFSFISIVYFSRAKPQPQTSRQRDTMTVTMYALDDGGGKSLAFDNPICRKEPIGPDDKDIERGLRESFGCGSTEQPYNHPTSQVEVSLED